MNRHRFIFVVALIIFSGFCCFSAEIPDMMIEDSSLTIEIKSCIEREKIQYILYGTPDALEKNRKELDKVLEFFRNDDSLDSVLYLVDFRGYMGLLNPIIKGSLKKEKEENGLTIFADFKGDLREYLKNDDKTVLFIILNENGEIGELYQLKRADEILKVISEG